MRAGEFGRVDQDNNVYVTDAGVERQVGQYPGVTADEALAYFVRKFEDLEAQVRLLEQRLAGSTSDHKSLASAHATLVAELAAPNAVGDLQSLRDRIARASGKIAERAAAESVEREQAVAAALEFREGLAARAEAIAAQGEKTNWKKAGAEMAELFEKWQAHQKSSVRVSKSQADPIWKRFSQARAKFERGRRAYFATLDEQFKIAKSAKSELVAEAEKLAAKGAESAAEYRRLQDRWKQLPKAGKQEDALWAKFRAAGDSIFAAKKAADEAQAVEQKANLEAKLALLKEAEAIDTSNLEAARKQFAEIAARWSKVGHVPKNDVRKVEDRLRKVERAIQEAENENWRRTDPAARDRSNSLIDQLQTAIAELEAQLKAKPGDKSIQDQLAARQAWLEAAKNAVD